MLKLKKKKKKIEPSPVVPVVPVVPVAPAPAEAGPVVEPAPEEMFEETIPGAPESPELPPIAPATPKEEVWRAEHVAVQTQEVIHNSETGENLTIPQSLVRLLNYFELEED